MNRAPDRSGCTRAVGRRARRAGGFAMVLVMVLVTVTLMLGLTFLVISGTSLGVSQNAEAHGQAVMIGDTGLATALAYIESDPDWRERGEGVWVSAHPFGGGTFTIRAEDGDPEAPGLSDPVRLVSLGRHNGVTYEAQRLLYEDRVDDFYTVSFRTFTMNGHTRIDGFDSANGRYDAYANADEEVALATNATSEGAISSSSAQKYIQGGFRVGPEGDVDAMLADFEEGEITGESFAMAETFDWPESAAMRGTAVVGPNQGGLAINSGTYTIDENRHYDYLSVEDGAELHIQGHVVIRVNQDFKVKEEGKIVIGNASSLKLYVGEDITINNGGVVNTNTGEPWRMVLYGVGNGGLDFYGEAQFCGIVDAPDRTLAILNDSHLYGAVVVDTLTLDGYSEVHGDVNPALKETNRRLPGPDEDEEGGE